MEARLRGLSCVGNCESRPRTDRIKLVRYLGWCVFGQLAVARNLTGRYHGVVASGRKASRWRRLLLGLSRCRNLAGAAARTVLISRARRESDSGFAIWSRHLYFGDRTTGFCIRELQKKGAATRIRKLSPRFTASGNTRFCWSLGPANVADRLLLTAAAGRRTCYKNIETDQHYHAS